MQKQCSDDPKNIEIPSFNSKQDFSKEGKMHIG